MTRLKLIVVLCILCVLVPFTGFPSFWRDGFVIAFSAISAVLASQLHHAWTESLARREGRGPGEER